MPTPSIQDRIQANPKFAELVGKRTRFAILLSLLVLVPYYSFMMIVAFNPALLAQPLGEGWVTSIGFPIGAALVIGSWLLTGVYIRRANGEFDALNEEILAEARK